MDHIDLDDGAVRLHKAIDLLLKAGAADKVLPQEESDDPGKV